MAQLRPLIIALDFSDSASAWRLADRLDPERCRLKVGFELFVSAGPEFVRRLVGRGFDVFLDLKFHDIPNTVASAVAAAAELGVWMVNLHASGGLTMMRAARAALAETPCAPKLVAVTVLTSMGPDDLLATGFGGTTEERVVSLARLAKQAELDGVVCSAREAASLKQHLGAAFLLVTPGIRPADACRQDQVRVMTPAEAIRAGSDYLVIGRPVTRAKDPLSVVESIYAELAVPPGA